MGMRFRKSVKLGPGIRVNISKSGLSTTIGPRGFTTSIGKSGAYRNVGVPGTGLSYRTKVSNGKASGKKAAHSQSKPSTPAAVREWQAYTGEKNPNVSIALDENGEIRFVDGNGSVIDDPALISIIKRTPQYKEQLPVIKERQRAAVAEMVESRNKQNESFIKVYIDSPKVLPRNTYDEALNTLAIRRYEPIRFDKPAPTLNDIKNELATEAAQTIKGAPWKRKKLREQYIAEHEQERLAVALDLWRGEKAGFEAAEAEKADKLNAQYEKEYSQERQALEAALKGDPEFIESACEEWIASCELPVEIATQFEYREEQHCLMVDLDLPEIEDLPTQMAVQMANGTLKVKDKTQKALRMEYTECVFGLAVFVAANLFNVSPAIRLVTVSGYTQRRNKAGDIADDYILSIKFTREAFAQVDYVAMDPEAFCLEFENRCNVTATKVFKTIEPFA